MIEMFRNCTSDGGLFQTPSFFEPWCCSASAPFAGMPGSWALSSTVIPPEDQQQIAAALDEDAQLMSTTELEALLVNEPADVSAEVVHINTVARPIALQAALLVPLVAGLLGFLASFRMVRLPDIKPSANIEGLVGG